MPTETIIAIIAITVPFVIFAITLGWADYYCHQRPPSPARHVPVDDSAHSDHLEIRRAA